MKKKILLASIIALSLALLVAVGGSIAWLVAETNKVENVFTPSDINISLTETASNFKMVPGNTITKDPNVAVIAGSEECWLFVKITEAGVAGTTYEFDDYLSYAIADGWTIYSGQKDVDNAVPGNEEIIIYRLVSATDASAGKGYGILLNNQITVNGEVTKQMMNAISNNNNPTLTFDAAAVQTANLTLDTAFSQIVWAD